MTGNKVLIINTCLGMWLCPFIGRRVRASTQENLSAATGNAARVAEDTSSAGGPDVVPV